MNVFETLLQDLRYGARTLLRHPSFTIVSILALALGIGVNVAVFTAYKAFIARPLDARDPDTLVNSHFASSPARLTRDSAIRTTKPTGTVCDRSVASSRFRSKN